MKRWHGHGINLGRIQTKVAKAMLVLLGVGMLATVHAEAASELHEVRLRNVVVPHKALAAVLEQGKKLQDAQLYVDVSRNGTLVWRSPARDVSQFGNQEKIVFPESQPDSLFFIPWTTGDDIFVQVMVAGKKALDGNPGVGAAIGGAVLAIGGAIAGFYMGGNNKALGATIGGVSGAAVGASAGYGIANLPMVKGAREIASFTLPRDTFGLNGTRETTINKNDVLKGGTVTAEWQGKKLQEKLVPGQLEEQKQYVVRLRTIHLPSLWRPWNEEYIMRVKGAKGKELYVFDMGKIPDGKDFPSERFFVLENTGDNITIEFQIKDSWLDETLFKIRQKGVPCGKVYDKKNKDAFLEFETFIVEQ